MGPKSSGGAAASGGFSFQHRVAAWAAVRILAEHDSSPPWGLPQEATFDWLRLETEQPVDDLLVGTSHRGLIFCQIKQTVQCSKAQDSEFASAIDQFVRQYLSYRDSPPGGRAWERPLDPALDRLVLVCGPATPATLRIHLPAVLDRIRSLVRSQTVNDAVKSRIEQQVLSTTLGHVKRSWCVATGTSPGESDIMKFFALCRIQILDLDPDGPAEVEAKSLLRTTVLYDPNDTNKAWDSLVLSCERMSANQSGADRHSLQQVLITTGINLRAPRSYREDIRRLKELSSRNIELLAHLSHIHFRGTEVKIRRPSTQELLRIAETDSIIVVGQPGAGKSGAIHDLAESLQQEDRDLLFLAADRISGQSLGEIQKELCLDHSLFDIF